MPRWTILAVTITCALVISSTIHATDADSIARGKKALETRSFTPAPWTFQAYDSAWENWQPKPEKQPADYDQAFRQRYGLHPAPFDNGKYPMGLRRGAFFGLPGIEGLTTDCMLCHGGSILGKSYVGLGNASLDIQAFFEDLNLAAGITRKLPHTFSNVRGTSEAGAMAVYLHSFRNPDMSVRLVNRHNWPLPDTLCEDVPAWWLLKKKKTMYHTGGADARSVRSIMQFMLTPNNGLAVFEKEEPVFKDIQGYLLSLEAPKYPFPIDAEKAATGHKLFNKKCAQCHGTYGKEWTYPSKIVPLNVIGTDPTRFDGLPKELGEHYNQSWFAKEKPSGYKALESAGYQAPPLDGVWATAPYFHNGSVPTLYHVLNSKPRPKIFTRSFRTDESDYDKLNVGWKVQILDKMPADLSAHERRKIYDTTQPGRGNMGHTFGDDLSDAERWAIIEYLKTL
ncbi:MAG: c-type cytochrome [Planctomycetes bacterium]|nr:c-type cytochrome [Planctomycetota bacterium]